MAKKYVPGQLGLFKPESTWTTPTELPDLRGRPVVALDTENRDDGLGSGRGPGWALGPMGYLCGVSWAAEGSVGYAPVRHPDSECLPQENVVRWVSDLHRSGTRVVFHNSPYDYGWLTAVGCAPPEEMEDTLAASVLLDETHRAYSLDACAARAGVPGKDTELLADAVEAYGGNRKRPQADIWRVPARYVGPYAEADAVATLALWQQCEPALRAQGIWDAYRLEMELVPMVVAMRRRGIRIDTDAALRTRSEFMAQRDMLLGQIGELAEIGRAVSIDDVNSPHWLERVFTVQKINFPRTSKANLGSFKSEWMEKSEHPLPRAVAQARKFHEAANKFIDNYILGFSHRGRIHAEIHQFLSEEGGTRSHRLSYSEPPLQQMTSPDKDPRDELKNLIEERAIGTKLRRIFLSERGTAWLAGDYSQQEPRMTVHFASLCKIKGAEVAVEAYRRNPRTDYHQFVADLTGMARPRAKILNLALTYGKGKRSTAEELGVSLEEAEKIMEIYFGKLTFIKPLEDMCKRLASQRGYIRLIDGSRMHYTQWEGGWIDWDVRKAAIAAGKNLSPCSMEEARERQKDPDHPWSTTRLRRADTRKALNNLVQGSAARQTKKAMLDMWREGIVPLLQMHDELDTPVSSEKEVERVGVIMREAIPLEVPVVVDLEVGPTWGNAKMSWSQYVEKYGAPS